MNARAKTEGRARFEVENVGGIDETSVEIPPGVTVLSGENATNRTSFLQAVQAAMGSTNASLKGNAEEGAVSLELDDDTYECELYRTNGSVAFDGDRYLEDATVADLFAFLLGDNEARQTVLLDGDLREVIMEPVDVERIRAEIEEIEAEKSEINDELAEIESRKQELPTLEERRTSLEEDIEETKEELAEKETEIEESSASVREKREEKNELEAALAELRETRSDLEEVRHEIESTEASIDSLADQRDELEDELESLPEQPMGEHADLDSEMDSLRRRKRELEREVQDLQSAIQFNQEMLADDGDGALADVLDADDGALTDQLVEDEVVCWTCGSQVTPEAIETTVDSLQSIRKEKLAETRSIEDELEELQSRRREAERAQEKRDDLESRLRDVEAEIERREASLETLRERKESLTERVKEQEAAVDELEDEDFGEVLDLHREANQLEFELDRLGDDLEETREEIEEIEAAIERAESLRERREELLEELETHRTRIDRIEAEAVEAFNTHMDEILEILDYDNVERIWIERREQTVREGRRNVEQRVFDLHIVRSTENDVAYEDTVDHLSESEREVTGLVFALAGYLVHDVHEEVPFMLLDSLEAIDSERIAALVEYFAEYPDYLLVALLPEDAAALDDDYPRVTEI